ncbi:MAG TPA: FecR domain-containing protein [Planctomycetota bacterium]
MSATNVELIERYFDDSLSTEEAARLLDLLRDDAEFRAEFARAARLHGLLNAAVGPDAGAEGLADVVAIAVPTGSRALDSKVMEKIQALRPRRSVWLLIGAIAACLALAAGLAFWPRGEAGAVVESLAGKAFRISDGAEARSGQTLRFGDGLRVDEGRAALRLPDGTRVELEANARLDRVEEKRVLLTRGALTARVAPQEPGAPLVFATPQGEARVLGTTLRISTHPKDGTRLEVEEGRVELKNDAGRAVVVESGRYAVAAPGVELVSKELDRPWKNATGNVGGNAWGFGGVHTLAAVPGRDELLAGVSERWLWSSRDGGATWARLPGEAKNRPWRIVFDPKDPRTFWVSGTYGPGVHRTTDGGASFRRLGSLESIDGLAVDFSDPERKTLLATQHWGRKGLRLSRDGGETWEKVGDRLPEEASSTSECFILDTETWFVNSLKPDTLYRTADAGKSWTRNHAANPNGPALLSSSGFLYWQGIYGSGLLRSVDRGASWAKLDTPVRTPVIELPDGRLVGAGGKQLYVSANKGSMWAPLGPPAPIEPVGVVYLPARRAFFVWHMPEAKTSEAIFRWDVPEGD